MKSAKDVFLILASMSFLVIMGAAVYEHVALIPVWTAAAPSSLAIFNGEYPLQPQYFWMAIHPITLLLMIVALITNWKNARRKNILIVLVTYVLILAVTSIYFVPHLISFMETPYQATVDENLTAQANKWEMLSLVRLGVLVILAYILLSSLTKHVIQTVVTTNIEPTLNYPNDALGG